MQDLVKNGVQYMTVSNFLPNLIIESYSRYVFLDRLEVFVSEIIENMATFHNAYYTKCSGPQSPELLITRPDLRR